MARVGCCGFALSQRQYYATFRLLEVQQTFYQPPQLATCRKWREPAPSDFEFTLWARARGCQESGLPLRQSRGRDQ